MYFKKRKVFSFKSLKKKRAKIRFYVKRVNVAKVNVSGLHSVRDALDYLLTALSAYCQ